MIPAMIIVFAIVQISIFRALPRGIKKYLSYWPLLAIGINFFGSFVILTFAGVAHFVGPANLMASCIFAGYVYGYKRYRGIHSYRRGKFRFPGLKEQRTGNNWLF